MINYREYTFSHNYAGGGVNYIESTSKGLAGHFRTTDNLLIIIVIFQKTMIHSISHSKLSENLKLLKNSRYCVHLIKWLTDDVNERIIKTLIHSELIEKYEKS